MFIAASYGMRRAELIAPDIRDIVNIAINQRGFEKPNIPS